MARPAGIPEWPKGAGCKPAGSAFRGSNPLPCIRVGEPMVPPRAPSFSALTRRPAPGLPAGKAGLRSRRAAHRSPDVSGREGPRVMSYGA